MEIGRGISWDEGLVEVREGPPDPERRLCPVGQARHWPWAQCDGRASQGQA